jgi:hypothetical protein
VGTYGLRLLKDLQCGAKYVKGREEFIIICSLKFMEKHSSEQPHCKQTNKHKRKGKCDLCNVEQALLARFNLWHWN